MNKSFLETIKAVDGKIYHVEYHQQRYESVLASLGVKTFLNLHDNLHPPSQGLYRCRVVYTKDTLEITYIPYKKRQIKTLKILHDNFIEYDKKYEDRGAINALLGKKERADDILIVKNSKITDTSIANIAFFDGVKWLTPNTPLLEGTTRKRLLKEGKIFLHDIYEEDLQKYKKVALLNAMIDFDILPIENIRDFYC